MQQRDVNSYLVRGYFSKTVLLLGLGAFLAGASVPLLNLLGSNFIHAKTANPSLVSLIDSPGVEAFPTTVSSEQICQHAQITAHPPAPSNRSIRSESLFHQHQLSQFIPSFRTSLSIPFNITAWPMIHPRAQLARVPILMYHDVIAEPEVFFDLTPNAFESQLQSIINNGLTPVSLDQVIQHLRTGLPLPEKPIALTFDDGYIGHYKYVFPLLKKYNIPAAFSVFPAKLDGDIVGRSTLSWEQLKEMAHDPLVTIVAHGVTHPSDLTKLDDQDLVREVSDSKQRLEEELKVPIKYFTYPAGHYDQRVTQVVANAGYLAAFTMREDDEKFAGNSESLLTIERFGQSNLEQLLQQSWGGPPTSSTSSSNFNFTSPLTTQKITIEDIPLTLISGGKPVTIHADSRYQLPDIIRKTNAEAAVDGGFFSLKYLDSNVMIGPVLSQSTRQFIPGNTSENPKLNGRPLVLISPDKVKFIPFDASHHNTLAGLERDAKNVTDAFVAAAWLVKDGEPQMADSFGSLFDFDARRHRAFWGINYKGQPVIGVSNDIVDSVTLGRLLAQAGLRDAVMLDSGASTSLTFQGESLVGYTPRPVPHAVALIPPQQMGSSPCPLTIAPN